MTMQIAKTVLFLLLSHLDKQLKYYIYENKNLQPHYY